MSRVIYKCHGFDVFWYKRRPIGIPVADQLAFAVFVHESAVRNEMLFSFFILQTVKDAPGSSSRRSEAAGQIFQSGCYSMYLTFITFCIKVATVVIHVVTRTIPASFVQRLREGGWHSAKLSHDIIIRCQVPRPLPSGFKACVPNESWKAWGRG